MSTTRSLPFIALCIGALFVVPIVAGAALDDGASFFASPKDREVPSPPEIQVRGALLTDRDVLFVMRSHDEDAMELTLQIWWGDGETSIIAAERRSSLLSRFLPTPLQAEIRHRYTQVGAYAITVLAQDEFYNTGGVRKEVVVREPWSASSLLDILLNWFRGSSSNNSSTPLVPPSQTSQYYVTLPGSSHPFFVLPKKFKFIPGKGIEPVGGSNAGSVYLPVNPPSGSLGSTGGGQSIYNQIEQACSGDLSQYRSLTGTSLSGSVDYWQALAPPEPGEEDTRSAEERDAANIERQLFPHSNYDVVHIVNLVVNKGLSPGRVSALYNIPESKILFVLCAWKNFPSGYLTLNQITPPILSSGGSLNLPNDLPSDSDDDNDEEDNSCGRLRTGAEWAACEGRWAGACEHNRICSAEEIARDQEAREQESPGGSSCDGLLSTGAGYAACNRTWAWACSHYRTCSIDEMILDAKAREPGPYIYPQPGVPSGSVAVDLGGNSVTVNGQPVPRLGSSIGGWGVCCYRLPATSLSPGQTTTVTIELHVVSPGAFSAGVSEGAEALIVNGWGIDAPDSPLGSELITLGTPTVRMLYPVDITYQIDTHAFHTSQVLFDLRSPSADIVVEVPVTAVNDPSAMHLPIVTGGGLGASGDIPVVVKTFPGMIYPPTSGGGTPPPPPPPPPAACADGADNDGDGKVDLADPGCSSATDNDETDTAPGGPLPPPTITGPSSIPQNQVNNYRINFTTTESGFSGRLIIDWGDGTEPVSTCFALTGTFVNWGVSHTWVSSGTFTMRATIERLSSRGNCGSAAAGTNSSTLTVTVN